jgi:glycerate dehydrogenase
LLDYDGDNLIITPHTAWASIEARQNAIRELAENTRAFLAGKPRNQLGASD